MKRLSPIFLGLAFVMQLAHAGKPKQTIYFPEDTKIVSGTKFIKVGIGTKKDIRNNTFTTYYISTTKVSRIQFTNFLNDIKADYKLAGIYNNDTCLLSDLGIIGKSPVNWNYNSKKMEWEFSPKNFPHQPIGMVSTFGADNFCRWFQQKTGEHVRLPKINEYSPTLPQNIQKYIRKNKKSLSNENIDLIKSLNIENFNSETEWAQNSYGSYYIMSYSKVCPKGLYIPMLCLSCTVFAIPITVPIMMFVNIPKIKFTSLSSYSEKYSSDNNSMFPTAEPDLGFRLVIPTAKIP